MAYQVQVKGSWGGAETAQWRPAVTGTMNQTSGDDAQASTFPTEEAARGILAMLERHADEGLDAERPWARAEFRLVETE
jgi:hypothetical protein